MYTCLTDKNIVCFIVFTCQELKKILALALKIEVIEMSYESSLGKKKKKKEIEDKGVPNVKYFLDSGTILTDLDKYWVY